ncbi:MAG: 2Fe-2S iron-sulfur cluster-binding protein [Exilibacterium sp.]
MVQVVYIGHDGERTELEVQEGWTLMQAAVSNGIDGIEAECGGSCCCATCHVYVDDAFVDKIDAPNGQEEAMLEGVVAERKPNSRLSCQIKVTSDVDGLVVNMPEVQS